MKAVVATFNQEKALVGAFSVLTNLRIELFQALLKDHIRRGHGYTKELTDQLMATLKTQTNATSVATTEEQLPPFVSLAANEDTISEEHIIDELNTKPSLGFIDIQQPMTNSTVSVKQENIVHT